MTLFATDYLEYYLTLVSWIVNNGIWAVLVSSGVFALPFVAIIVQEWLKARGEGADEGNKGVLSAARIENRVEEADSHHQQEASPDDHLKNRSDLSHVHPYLYIWRRSSRHLRRSSESSHTTRRGWEVGAENARCQRSRNSRSAACTSSRSASGKTPRSRRNKVLSHASI